MDKSSSSSSSSSENSEDFYEYFAPQINLPRFLNTDYKWNKTVIESDTMEKYCNLIGKITNLNFPDQDKYLVMYYITTDIVMCQKKLIPHWKLLQQHALFAHADIL